VAYQEQLVKWQIGQAQPSAPAEAIIDTFYTGLAGRSSTSTTSWLTGLSFQHLAGAIGHHSPVGRSCTCSARTSRVMSYRPAVALALLYRASPACGAAGGPSREATLQAMSACSRLAPLPQARSTRRLRLAQPRRKPRLSQSDRPPRLLSLAPMSASAATAQAFAPYLAELPKYGGIHRPP
jgi:hypothetical protein